MSLVCQILYPHVHATRVLAHLVKKMGCGIHPCTVDISINICVRYEASREKLTSWLDARKCPKTDNSDAVEMEQEAAVGSLLDWQGIAVHVPARHPSALIILLCLLRVLLGGGGWNRTLSAVSSEQKSISASFHFQNQGGIHKSNNGTLEFDVTDFFHSPRTSQIG